MNAPLPRTMTACAASASEPIGLDDGRVLDITVSVGLASPSASMPRDTLEQLLSRADAALYRAKAMGRNRVVA